LNPISIAESQLPRPVPHYKSAIGETLAVEGSVADKGVFQNPLDIQ